MLYIAGCPSHHAAVELVKNILRSEGLVPDVFEVLVQDQGMAEELRFRGSPTIRINGRDVDDVSEVDKESPVRKNRANTFALSCRFYPKSQQVALPPAELVRRAVAEARKGSRP